MAYQQKLKQSSLKPRRIKTEHDANSDDHKEYEAPSQNNKEISTTMKPPHNQCEHVERSARTEAKQSNTENERQCYEAALKKSHANDMEHKLKQQIQTLKESLKQKDTQIASLREEMDLALQDEDDHKEYEVIKQYTEKINCKLTQTESEYNANMQQLRRQIESFTSKIEGYKMKIKRMKEYTENITEQCVRKQEQITQLKQLTEDSASYGKQTEYNELEASSMGATTHHLKPAHPDSDSDDESLNHQHDDDAKPYVEMIQNIKKEHQGLLEKKNEECAQARVELNIKKQELEHAMQQVDEHTTSLRNAQMKQIQCTQMQQYIACEKADIHTLQQERQKLNEIIQQKDDKIDALRSTSEYAISLQAKSVEDKQCIKKQQQQIQTLKKEIKRVCGNMEIMQVSFDAKETQCAEMEQNIKLYTSNKLQQKAQKLNETIQTLTERFRSAQAQAKQWKAALSLQNGEKERLQHQIQQKEQDMQLQKAKANKLQQETQKRNETIETLTKRLRSAQTQAKQWKEASKQQNQDEAHRFKGHQDKYHKHMAVCKENKERLQYEIQQKCDEIDSLKAERETITTQLREKENEYKKVLEEQKQSKALYLKETQCSRRLQSSYFALQKECDQMKILHEEERSVIKKEKEDAIAQIQSLQQLEDERKQTHDQRNKEIHAKEEELSRRLEAKQRELDQKGKEHEVLLAEYTQKQEETKTFKAQLESSQREAQRLGVENEQYREKENNQLNARQELEEVNTKYNKLKNTLQQLDKDQEALKTKHRQYQQRIGALQQQLKSESSAHSIKHNEYNALEQRWESERWAHTMKSNELDALATKHSALIAKYNDLMKIILIQNDNRLNVTKKELDELAIQIQSAFAAQVNGLTTSKIDILLQQQKYVFAQYKRECELSEGLKRALRQHRTSDYQRECELSEEFQPQMIQNEETQHEYDGKQQRNAIQEQQQVWADHDFNIGKINQNDANTTDYKDDQQNDDQ